ncbi:MAG: PrgI family protein [Lachnospiraceae bacterium]|nr:PrgI family protein [Lachnospiraceae bacterium]
MAIAVDVPKNLSGIKTKVALNLTKRQLICFGAAAATGIPLYLVTKKAIGTDIAAIIMIAVMLPFFLLAMYEKDGMPAEKVLKLVIRQKYLSPGIRRYRSENLFRQMEERENMRREVIRLEAKAERYKEQRRKKQIKVN